MDYDKCHCGGRLRAFKTMVEIENALEQLSLSKKGNLFTRYWNGLNKKRKIGIVLGLFLILLAFIIISSSILNPKIEPNSINPQPSVLPAISPHQSNKTPYIEIRIITNSSWEAYSTIYYQNGTEIDIETLGNQDPYKGTGSKTFRLNKTPMKLNIQIKKTTTNDFDELIVELLINGTVVKSETTSGPLNDKVIIDYDFEVDDGF